MAKKKKKKNQNNFIGNILLYLFIIVLAFFGITFIVNISQSTSEANLLFDKGYYNLKDTDYGHLNVYSKGNNSGKHIVGLSGFNQGDFSLTLDLITADLQDDHLVSVVDRPGYGFSESTEKELNVKDIVSALRKALSNSDIGAPYVLVAPFEASLFATYWDQTYPEEIEAIIYLDGTIISSDTNLDLSLPSPFLVKTGLYRFNVNKKLNIPAYYSKEQTKMAKGLQLKTLQSRIISKEMEIYNSSIKTLSETLKDTDSKKFYLNHSYNQSQLSLFLNKLGNYTITSFDYEFFINEDSNNLLKDKISAFLGQLN